MICIHNYISLAFIDNYDILIYINSVNTMKVGYVYVASLQQKTVKGIEKIFRSTKDNEHCAIRPQFHYTDQKIRVHIFCCLLGLTLQQSYILK